LTPIECERLQGFPDNWTKYGTKGEISDSQRYKMCGNAVTVDVVQSVAKNILKVL
jgi:DNA (cytosine-5)-methyltransferase 1